MTVEEAVRTRILDLAPVTALVSTRVHLDKLPQNPTLPAVRVQLVIDGKSQHLRGPNGLCRGRVQVDAFAVEDSGVDPYAQVTALTEAIDGDGLGPDASGVFGWTGSLGSPAFEVSNVAYAAERRRTYEPNELRIVGMILDYYVWWRQT